MDMYWIINDNIEFRPTKKTLTSVKDAELSVVLTAPATRCLLLLLEAYPEIVMQQEFFKKVWEEEGMLVPTNTLYQNISIVRRGLRSVGQSNEAIIVTIPRKGFQIDDDINIACHHEDEVIDDPKSENSDPGAADDFIAPHKDNEKNLSRELPSACISDARETLINKKPANKFGAKLSYILMLTLLALSLAGYGLIFKNAPSSFSSYIQLEQEGNCHFFSESGALDDKSNYQRFKLMLKNSGLNCKSHPWIYFSSENSAPVLAAITCRREYKTSQPDCVSLYFLQVNDG